MKSFVTSTGLSLQPVFPLLLVLSNQFGKPGILDIISEIIDVFWCLRCQNDHITLPDIIGTIAAGTTVLLVAKNLTKPKKYKHSKFQLQFWGI